MCAYEDEWLITDYHTFTMKTPAYVLPTWEKALGLKFYAKGISRLCLLPVFISRWLVDTIDPNSLLPTVQELYLITVDGIRVKVG